MPAVTPQTIEQSVLESLRDVRDTTAYDVDIPDDGKFPSDPSYADGQTRLGLDHMFQLWAEALGDSLYPQMIGLITGLSVLDPVLDIVPVLPGAPTAGDRYISSADNRVVEWGGTSWVWYVPVTGDAVWVVDESEMYWYDGSDWVAFSGDYIQAGAGLYRDQYTIHVGEGWGIDATTDPDLTAVKRSDLDTVYPGYAESESITGLWTFNRGSAQAPFAVLPSDAAYVQYLDADKVDGLQASQFARSDEGDTIAGDWLMSAAGGIQFRSTSQAIWSSATDVLNIEAGATLNLVISATLEAHLTAGALIMDDADIDLNVHDLLDVKVLEFDPADGPRLTMTVGLEAGLGTVFVVDGDHAGEFTVNSGLFQVPGLYIGGWGGGLVGLIDINSTNIRYDAPGGKHEFMENVQTNEVECRTGTLLTLNSGGIVEVTNTLYFGSTAGPRLYEEGETGTDLVLDPQRTTAVVEIRGVHPDVAGATLSLIHRSPTPATNDEAGVLNFKAYNDAGPAEVITYGSIKAIATTITDGSEVGRMEYTALSGAHRFMQDLQVDAIQERTGAAGVTIDSCLIKDGAAANSLLLGGQNSAYHLDSDNFTGTDWTDLTDAGETALHIHDDRYYTETELDAGQLDDRYYTETELDAGQLDNRYYTETEVDALTWVEADITDLDKYTQAEVDALVAGQNELSELTDVNLAGPADLDLLQYDNGSSKWVDRTLAEAGIAATGHTHDDRYYTETEEDTWRSNVTQTEMSYLDGIDSDIQTQLDGKLGTGAKAADSELLDGQEGAWYQDAGNLTGTVHTDRYSAYADLGAEGYLDNDAGGDLLTRTQLDARFLAIAAQAADSALLGGENAAHYHDAGNLTGTISTDRYSAYADLTAEGYLNNDAVGDLLTQAQLDARFLAIAAQAADSVLLGGQNSAWHVALANATGELALTKLGGYVAQGDLIVGGAADYEILSVGTAGQILMADATPTPGWTTAFTADMLFASSTKAYFDAGAAADGEYIYAPADNILALVSGGYVKVGVGSPTWATGVGDFFVSARLEVAGVTKFLGTWVVLPRVYHDGPLGSLTEIFWREVLTEVSRLRADFGREQMTWGFGAGIGRQLVLSDIGFHAKNFDHADAGRMVLYVQSETDPDDDPDEWISFCHNTADGIIAVGSGAVYIGATANQNIHAAEFHLGASAAKYIKWDGSDVVFATDAGTFKFTGGDVVLDSNLTLDWSVGFAKPRWYEMADEPTLGDGQWCLWTDTDDDSWWIVASKGSTQMMMQFGGTAHAKLHDIDSVADHNGIAGAVENNFVSFDANRLPKDSGQKHADYSLSGHNHDAAYPGIADAETITGAWAFNAMQDVTFDANKILDLYTNGGITKIRLIEAEAEPTLNPNETAWWYDTVNAKMYWGVQYGSGQHWVEATVD